MNSFNVIFNIADGNYNWFLSGIGLIFILISVSLIFFSRWYYSNNSRLDSSKERLFFNLNHPFNKNAFTRFPKFIFIFALCFTMLSFLSTFSTYKSISKTYNNKKYAILEGNIESVNPTNEDGKELNIIVINGIELVYSNYNINNSFNNIGSYRGKIKEGDFIRIYYQGKNILRLEVKE